MLASKMKIVNGRVITKDATPTKQELDDRIQSLIQAIDNAHKSGDQNAYFENQKSLEKVKEQRKQLYGDSKTKDKKMRDGQSYNMAVENELFTYYNIPRNQARPIVERNSQELQKKEDAGVSARNAADMLMHKEGIKGFEKIYVRPNDSRTKDSETAESLLRQFKARRLLDDRREYDVEDFMSTYDLPRAEAQKLFDMVQKATRDSKTKDMVDSNVISDTLDDIKAGKDPNRAFAAALEDNNFYGPKSKQDRVDMANALRSKGINVNLATVEKMLGISDSKDAIDPTKPKNIAAAKNLSVAQGKAASDGGPGSGQKGHTTHHIPDPSTHQERRKERANLQKYIENARRSGNIKEAQKHSQRLAHINSLQLKG